jgi:hypothetical protein
MRIPQSYIQKCKVVGHTFQSIFIFVGLCITIAVFTKEGETGGATRYYLALVSGTRVSSNNFLCLSHPSALSPYPQSSTWSWSPCGRALNASPTPTPSSPLTPFTQSSGSPPSLLWRYGIAVASRKAQRIGRSQTTNATALRSNGAVKANATSAKRVLALES